MNFIIYDLEATCWQHKQPHLISEIIEIGAVKINSNGQILSEFEKFIRPVEQPTLSAFCTELTSITQSQVNGADEYDIVCEDFMDWCGVDYDDYLLCSWGAYDKKMLVQDCKRFDMEYRWAEQHINVKSQYKRIQGLRKPIGLKRAVDHENFEWIGTHHRGIDDARNLAQIFIRYQERWSY